MLLLAAALIVYGSLYPWHFDFNRDVHPLELLLFSWPPVWNRFLLRDVALNVFIYAPIGGLAFLVFAQRHSRAFAWAAAAAFGLLLSLSMELLQAYVPSRDTSLSDVLSNTAGSIAGAAAALLFGPALERAMRRRARRPIASGAILLALWICAQLYPFFPLFGRTRFRGALAALFAPASFSAAETWAAAAEWFAVALVLEALLGRLKARWLLAVMLCLPLRCFVITRSLRIEEVWGALAAVVLWLVLRDSARLTAGVWLMASAILVAELAPFHFSSHAAGFSWVPFAASIKSGRDSSLIVFCRKLFDYGVMLWLARRAGVSYAAGAGVLAAVLAALEFLQRYLPGRTPDITDSVLAVLMAIVLWFSDFRLRRGLA